jgi:hypothetical protein
MTETILLKNILSTEDFFTLPGRNRMPLVAQVMILFSAKELVLRSVMLPVNRLLILLLLTIVELLLFLMQWQ